MPSLELQVAEPSASPFAEPDTLPGEIHFVGGGGAAFLKDAD